MYPSYNPVREAWAGTPYSSTGTGVNSPFIRSGAVWSMMPDWQIMNAVVSGTQSLRQQCTTYLPQEPREDDDAYATRVKRSVLSPFTLRLIENAAGLVLRRPITVNGDPYWQDFSKNVDGLGSSINEYARRILVSALTYGHSGTLVDFPPGEGIRTLADEIALGRRPYFIPIQAPSVWGWRQETNLPSSQLSQLRIHETAVVPEGDFGETQEDRIRVLYPGRYELYNEGGKVETGTYSLNEIPFVPLYTNRTGMLSSIPPLLDIANLNITHYQRQADLIHALHIAAMPTLVLEGWDETDNAGVGVNYAISMQPGNKAYYVGADSSSFDAQQTELSSLEAQMSTLGVTKLLGQKFVAESADAKRIDQAQANSVLSIISMEMESALQICYNIAAKYVNKTPPQISLDRDFDFYRLLGQDISVIDDLAARGAITNRTFLQILKSGEILPDMIDLDAEMRETEALRQQRREEELGNLDTRPMGSDNETRRTSSRAADPGTEAPET